MILDKIIVSELEPENTGVIWIKPIKDGYEQYIFLNNKWVNINNVKEISGIVSSVNNQAPDENGNINITKEDIGLEKVDNTSDTEKVVKGASEDGSGNNIAATYETKTDATTKQTGLQTAINAIQTTVDNLVGLEGTNYAGFSIDATEADALAAIPTKYTAAGYTDELVWYLAGDGIDNLKAYHYNGTNTPVLVSSKVYDFTDFSGIAADVSALRFKINQYKDATTLSSSQFVTTTSLNIVDGVVSEKTGSLYKVIYLKKLLHKDDRLRFTATTSSLRKLTVGFTETDPQTLNTLVGLQLNIVHDSGINGAWDIYIDVPLDGYMIMYLYEQDWSGRHWDYIEYVSLKDTLSAIKGSIADTDRNVASIRDSIELFKDYSDFETSIGPITNNEGYIGYGTSTNYKHTSPIEVTAGEKWYIKVYTSGNNAHRWSLWATDNSGQILDTQLSYGTGFVWKEIVYTIPEGVTHISIVHNVQSPDDWIIKREQTVKGKVNDIETKLAKGMGTLSYLGMLVEKDASFEWDGKINNTTINGTSETGYSVEAGSNSYYMTEYLWARKGTVIKILGSSTDPNTPRAVKIAMCAAIPTIGSELTGYSSETFPSTGRTFEYIVPNDGYVVLYRYRQWWATYTETISRVKLGNEGITDDKYLPMIAQAAFSSSTRLGLLHYTDIHGDDKSVETILDAISRYAPYIDDVICSGDSVHYYADSTSEYPQGNDWWADTGLAEKSLFVIGNHDSATTASTQYDQIEDSAAWDGKGKAWCNSTFFAPYAERLGITLPEGACYWHKDYAAQKIRVIGLDCLHRFDGICDPSTGAVTTNGVKWLTNEQEVWLIARLNETLDSNNAAYGYSVVFICHYPLDNFSGDNMTWDESSHRFVCNANVDGGRLINRRTNDVVNFHLKSQASYSATVKFNMRNRVDNGYGGGSAYPNYTQGTVNNVGEIIKAWIQRGGKYIVWLCGHTHFDMMYYPSMYPNMLVVTCDQAGCMRGTTTGDRSLSLESSVAINYYSIDTYLHLFKIVRIGYTSDKWMTPKDVLCYDYQNRTVVNEW